MQHYTQHDDDMPHWPLGSSIAVKFPYYGDDSNFVARAALIAVSAELKEAVEAAAKSLASNDNTRAVQFYWPLEVITNEIYNQPIPKQYSHAIKELLDADFSEAIPDSVARDAIQRVCSLKAVTWISVGRHPFMDFGATVSLGCTTLCIDFTATTGCLVADTKVSAHTKETEYSQDLIRAVEDLYESTLRADTDK